MIATEYPATTAPAPEIRAESRITTETRSQYPAPPADKYEVLWRMYRQTMRDGENRLTAIMPNEWDDVYGPGAWERDSELHDKAHRLDIVVTNNLISYSLDDWKTPDNLRRAIKLFLQYSDRKKIQDATAHIFPTKQSANWTYVLTDLGNAEMFRDACSENLRYVHPKQQWLVYRDHRWMKDSGQGAMNLAMELVRQAGTAASAMMTGEMREKAIRHYLASESSRALKAMIDLAKNLAPIADDGRDWDQNPDLIGCPNGVIEFHSKTGEVTFRDGRPEDRITMVTRVEYDPDAKSLAWNKFRRQTLPDPEVTDWTSRAIGYSLTGHTREQISFWAYGEGSNGKGVENDTIAYILGDYAWTVPYTTFMGRQMKTGSNDIAGLIGKRYVVCSEVPTGAKVDEQRLKSLTGEDTVTARFLYGEFFEFRPQAKLWFGVNHRPVVKDESEGYWRRIRLVGYTQRFTKESVPPRDDNLREKLRQEAAGIFAWAVRCATRWYATGLADVPESVTAATKDYRAENDLLAGFIEAACVLTPTASVKASGFYEAFKDWCHEAESDEGSIPSQTTVGTRMGNWPGVEKRVSKKGKEYHGLGLQVGEKVTGWT